ncbi:UNKNOWN [Stylonychia lemnae]|uniref:Uncharacterized protein n=1 Tax=Stylonychia lemnae TaxID=5949 RepID=A0A078AFL1_STYLE|nr:UNKNOWN [Stylonychia lemnae]|eukprot:CDW81005.1 UNKNOWN [Stylonychia lemnae]
MSDFRLALCGSARNKLTNEYLPAMIQMSSYTGNIDYFSYLRNVDLTLTRSTSITYCRFWAPNPYFLQSINGSTYVGITNNEQFIIVYTWSLASHKVYRKDNQDHTLISNFIDKFDDYQIIVGYQRAANDQGFLILDIVNETQRYMQLKLEQNVVNYISFAVLRTFEMYVIAKVQISGVQQTAFIALDAKKFEIMYSFISPNNSLLNTTFIRSIRPGDRSFFIC